jgi:hypothetical protein
MDAAYVTARLVLLEKRLKRRAGLPVPRMSARKRMEYLKEMRGTT